VLFAGSRFSEVPQSTCGALVERFVRHGFSFSPAAVSSSFFRGRGRYRPAVLAGRSSSAALGEAADVLSYRELNYSDRHGVVWILLKNPKLSIEIGHK
jgi:hypothetical protein